MSVVQKIDNKFSYVNLTADALVKSGAGVIHTITFGQTDAAPTAGTITFYDNLAESGQVIYKHTFTTAIFYPASIVLDCIFGTGLYAGFDTTGDVSVTITYK